MISEFQFGPWLPEVTDYKNPGLEECKNAIPSPSGYLPAYDLSGSGVTVTGTIIGARAFERADGTPVLCVATTSDLYTIISGTANASSLSLTLSAATDQVVFEQFNAKVYASTKNGDVWVLDAVETDTTFAAATGSPPNANAMGRIDDFLVLGDVDDGTDYPYRLQWSQFNNPDGSWVADIATQAGYVDMNSQHGPVTAISGGTFGMVFQKYGVSRMDYIGGASIFYLELYEKNRGCIAPASVLRRGDIAYYLSDGGFFETDGASVRPISRGRIWEWFLDNSTEAYRPFVSGAIDWARRCCVWTFSGEDGQDYTKQIWYNWETESWSWVDQGVDILVSTAQDGTTLEQLAVTYPDLDAMSVSLDSPIFQSQGRTMAAFSSGELMSLTGLTLEAEMTTGSLQPVTGRRTFVRGVTPLIANESEGTKVAVGSRDTMTRAYSTSMSTVVGPIGFSPQNADGRYFRLVFTVPAQQEWSDAYGYQIDHSTSGLT